MPRRFTALVVLGCLSLAAPAAAQRRADRAVHAIVNERLVAVVNPMGAEHGIAAGLRAPLGDPDELLFQGAHAETGIVNYTSPVYSTTGAYLQVSPLAFLVLRAEIVGLEMWPIGLDGAGYFPVVADRAPLARGELQSDRGSHASGWGLTLSTILQGAVPIGPLRLIVWDQIGVEHVRLGEAPYYYHPRYDAVLARQDWVITNWAMVLLEAELGPGTRLRFGGYDELRDVPRSGAFANQAGLVAALAIERADPAVPELMPIVRLGIHTHRRAGAGELTLLVGLLARYDLGAL